MNVHTSCACFSLLTLKEVQLRCGYLRTQTGGPLTPRGLSSLWRQPAPFAFIPTFSADAATLKTHQPDNAGWRRLEASPGVHGDAGCAAGTRAQEKSGCCLCLQCWTPSQCCPAGSIPACRHCWSQALWEAGDERHGKQLNTFKQFNPSLLPLPIVQIPFSFHISNSFTLQSCSKI